MSPDRFREELKRFDRALDFEFNGTKGRWEIVGTDRKNVKYLIKAFPLGEIGTVGIDTIKELYECSPIKQGGAAALNRRIDDLKETEEKHELKNQQNMIDARNEDAWMHLQYRNGCRVSFNEALKDRDSITVTDRRRWANMEATND